MNKKKFAKSSKECSPIPDDAMNARGCSKSLENKQGDKKDKIRPVYTLEEMVSKMKKNNQHPLEDWGEVGEEIVEWNEDEVSKSKK